MGLELFTDLARSLERACFDYLLLEDSSFIGEAYGGNRDACLKYGVMTPRQDPAIVATVLACATSRLGIIPTLAPFSHPPYLLARMLSSLDQISGGRAGWNMVTGSSDLAAENYGQERLPAHDNRYAIADEYTDLVQRLWRSWAPDAIIADRKGGTLIDPSKVKTSIQGEVFQLTRTAQFGTLAPGYAGDRPGRRLGSRAAVRLEVRRHNHRGERQERVARLSRRRQVEGRSPRAQAGRRQGHVLRPGDPGREPGGRPGPA